MSLYSVHKIAHKLRKDPAFGERMRQDPVAAIADFKLTDEERTAILNGDVGRLAQMGAHGYLLLGFAQQRVSGVTMDNYSQRIHTPDPTA